jgi:hypothetical protein
METGLIFLGLIFLGLIFLGLIVGAAPKYCMNGFVAS